ncbi:SymE family type I addiction module toxin [Yersinia alsatica]|uniref:SymE family type I addiction module toxin n=1 Tax=Yersinia alsatica TaxID=2890317 RepID=UPI0011A6675C|nr:SymE family type I addiction module toxin [Yersinia alsatica]
MPDEGFCRIKAASGNGGRPNPSPQLTIKGKWLEELGFSTGQPVSITAEDGCLVIRAEV